MVNRVWMVSAMIIGLRFVFVDGVRSTSFPRTVPAVLANHGDIQIGHRAPDRFGGLVRRLVASNGKVYRGTLGYLIGEIS